MTKFQIPPRGWRDDGFGEAAEFTGAFDARPEGFCKKEIFSDIGDKIHIYPHRRPLRFDETWSVDLMSIGLRETYI